ncbi:MAG: SDR family oxidoreductase [Desulfobacterales bacterium]|nr:SDR family oxidoreductase [Desulfobacterales bacterium]
MNLKDKVALVLGSIKGIGKEIGMSLCEEGAKVALTYFDWEEHLEPMRTTFDKKNYDYLISKINLLETEKIHNLIEKIIKKFGKIDILINNIERGGWPIVHGPYTEEQWNLEMETTLRAKWWVFNSVFPYLKLSNNGNVINISSIAGIVGRCGPASYIFNDGYSSANRGISLLTETWARLAAPNVRVNEIMLGFFETRHGENTRGWGLLTDEQKQAILDHTLISRTGKIDDIIKTVLFILNDAPFMTGSIIRLDGGYVLGGEKVHPMPKGVINSY